MIGNPSSIEGPTPQRGSSCFARERRLDRRAHGAMSVLKRRVKKSNKTLTRTGRGPPAGGLEDAEVVLVDAA